MLPPTEYDPQVSVARLRDLFRIQGIALDAPGGFSRVPYWTPRAQEEADFQRRMAYIGRTPEVGGVSAEDVRDETILEYLSREYDFRGGPDEVRAYLSGQTPLDVEACIKLAEYLGCRVRDFSPYHQEQIDHFAHFSRAADELGELDERIAGLLKRLDEVARALPGWLQLRHEAVARQVVCRVGDFYRDVDSPEQIEGIDHGLDYLGILKSEGTANALYQVAMDELDGVIEREIQRLDDDDQIALLLPLCTEAGFDSDMRELVADGDWPVGEWPKVLRQRFGHAWSGRLRTLVLETVAERSRVASREIDPVSVRAGVARGQRESDKVLFEAVIAGTVTDMLSPELADSLEAAYLRNKGDAEMDSLFERAVDAYSAAMLAATADL